MSDAYETLKLEVADFVATVTLDRPPVNAMNRAMREEIVRVFDVLHDRPDVRAVVLTAAITGLPHSITLSKTARVRRLWRG